MREWFDVSLPIEWKGDLDDDCIAEWCCLLLHAEWMDGDTWWWAVSDQISGQEIDSSNNDGYFDIRFNSGISARKAAEMAAREYRRRRPT